MNNELYKMIRVAYRYGDDVPDSLIAYGLSRKDFQPVVNLYNAGYKEKKDTPTTTRPKQTSIKTKGAKK